RWRRGEEARRQEQRGDRGEAHRADAYGGDGSLTEVASDRQQDQGAGQGERGDEPKPGEHAYPPDPRLAATSSGLGPRSKRRASASPTATSEAAVARRKKNITCPSAWPQRAPATTRASPAAFSMISIEIRTKTTSRRASTPTRPIRKRTPASRSPWAT